MNVLITAIGKRVQLLNYLRRSLKVVGIDCSSLNAAKNFVDKFYEVPNCTDVSYIREIIKICKLENVDLIIPLHEKEFEVLENNREKFKSIGVEILLSSKEIIEICNDKISTHKFFKENNIISPTSYSKKQIQSRIDNNQDINYPLIIKPINGMGSIDVFKVNNSYELKFFLNYVKNPIIQSFIEGTEYTIDVLLDLDANIISLVPRVRIEVRSGEVSKSRVEKNIKIIKKTEELIYKLKKYGDIKGPLTIQCIVNDNGIYFIEINCRFGGGVPLSFESGIDYGNYIKKMYDGESIERIYNFKELTMIRYDFAVYEE